MSEHKKNSDAAHILALLFIAIALSTAAAASAVECIEKALVYDELVNA